MSFVLVLWALSYIPNPPPYCPPGVSYQHGCVPADPLPVVSLSTAEFGNLFSCEYALEDIQEQTSGTVTGKCYVKKLPNPR